MKLTTKILLTLLTVVVSVVAVYLPTYMALNSGMDVGEATLTGVILAAIWGYAGSQAGILIWMWH